MWTSGQIPSYLHRWGSTEDIMGIQHYSSLRHHHERRRGSLVSYHEEGVGGGGGGPYRPKRRRSEDSGYALRGVPRVAVLSGSGGGVICTGDQRGHEDDFLRCFGHDEVISFIDETPLASPMKSPRRASAVSLLPQGFEVPRGVGGQQVIIPYPHFPLTHFEREPQALRRLSDHGRGCILTELPQDHGGRGTGAGAGGGSSGSRRGSRVVDVTADSSPHRAGNGSAGSAGGTGGSCGSGKGCSFRDARCAAQDAGPHGTGTQVAEKASIPVAPPGQKHRTGSAEGGEAWEAEQRLLLKMESKGSTNSFISSPSASSSGYVTFHSDSVGSTT